MTQKELIKKAIALAGQHIGVPYVRWGKDENGFDCSWLWLRVFSQMGIDFAVRFRTVEFFADAKPIALEQVQEGDVMFWHEEPGKTEHNFVYHIEMIVDKPFLFLWLLLLMMWRNMVCPFPQYLSNCFAIRLAFVYLWLCIEKARLLYCFHHGGD